MFIDHYIARGIISYILSENSTKAISRSTIYKVINLIDDNLHKISHLASFKSDIEANFLHIYNIIEAFDSVKIVAESINIPFP